MSKKSLSDHLAAWEKLWMSIERNAGDLRVCQAHVETLKAAIEEAREAKTRQLTLRAAAQQASRDLEAALAKARDMEARLNQAVFGTYGRKSPKLIEFGLSPRKPTGPRQKKSPEAEDATPPATKPRRPRKS